MSANDILITGTGRSGTTLSCHLLNKLPDTVALFEPMRPRKFAKPEHRGNAAALVEHFCERQRESIRERGRAVSKNADGDVPDNAYGAAHAEAGLRERVVSKGAIVVDRELGPDFALIVKHISAFTAVLSELVERFPVYAVVRNPLPVLASWNSIDFPLQNGHVPAAERLDSELRESLAAIGDPLDRQIHVLGWFHGQFHGHLPQERIIRYESIVSSGGAALEVIRPQAAALNEPLESRNRSSLYDRGDLSRIADRLLASEGAHWKSYSRESVERLLEREPS